MGILCGLCPAVGGQAQALWEPADLSGWLIKNGNRSGRWKRRFFVLKGSHLFWFESNSSSSPSGLLPLEGCQVQATTVVDAVADEPYCIRITVFDQLLDVCRHGAITVAAASEDLQMLWVRALHQAAVSRPELLARLQAAGGLAGVLEGNYEGAAVASAQPMHTSYEGQDAESYYSARSHDWASSHSSRPHSVRGTSVRDIMHEPAVSLSGGMLPAPSHAHARARGHGPSHMHEAGAASSYASKKDSRTGRSGQGSMMAPHAQGGSQQYAERNGDAEHFNEDAVHASLPLIPRDRVSSSTPTAGQHGSPLQVQAATRHSMHSGAIAVQKGNMNQPHQPAGQLLSILDEHAPERYTASAAADSRRPRAATYSMPAAGGRQPTGSSAVMPGSSDMTGRARRVMSTMPGWQGAPGHGRTAVEQGTPLLQHGQEQHENDYDGAEVAMAPGVDTRRGGARTYGHHSNIGVCGEGVPRSYAQSNPAGASAKSSTVGNRQAAHVRAAPGAPAMAAYEGDSPHAIHGSRASHPLNASGIHGATKGVCHASMALSESTVEPHRINHTPPQTQTHAQAYRPQQHQRSAAAALSSAHIQPHEAVRRHAMPHGEQYSNEAAPTDPALDAWLDDAASAAASAAHSYGREDTHQAYTGSITSMHSRSSAASMHSEGPPTPTAMRPAASNSAAGVAGIARPQRGASVISTAPRASSASRPKHMGSSMLAAAPQVHDLTPDFQEEEYRSARPSQRQHSGSHGKSQGGSGLAQLEWIQQPQPQPQQQQHVVVQARLSGSDSASAASIVSSRASKGLHGDSMVLAPPPAHAFPGHPIRLSQVPVIGAGANDLALLDGTSTELRQAYMQSLAVTLSDLRASAASVQHALAHMQQQEEQQMNDAESGSVQSSVHSVRGERSMSNVRAVAGVQQKPSSTSKQSTGTSHHQPNYECTGQSMRDEHGGVVGGHQHQQTAHRHGSVASSRTGRGRLTSSAAAQQQHAVVLGLVQQQLLAKTAQRRPSISPGMQQQQYQQQPYGRSAAGVVAHVRPHGERGAAGSDGMKLSLAKADRGVAPSQGHAPATGYGYSAVNGLHEEAEATEVTHSSSRTQQALLQGLATMRARYGTHSTVASMA